MNTQKSDSDPSICKCLSSSLPDAPVIAPSQATLLGSPIGDNDCVSAAIQDKVSALQRMIDRLAFLSAHDALLLLRSSFSIPKLLYLLRSAPCFASDTLKVYDSVLASTLSKITNTSINPSSAAWLQASLPVILGGLGVGSAVDVAPSAFLASAYSLSALVQSILSSSQPLLSSPLVSCALSVWSSDHVIQPPVDDEVIHQKAWDRPRAESAFRKLFGSALNAPDRAHLLAVSRHESGAWLYALPLSNLGLHLDSVRIAVGLRLGTPLCAPHQCQRRGQSVDPLGRHGLSCRRREGRHPRHAALNDVIHRALS